METGSSLHVSYPPCCFQGKQTYKTVYKGRKKLRACPLTRKMSRQVVRERNERGMLLFLQNLKGVTNLFRAPQEIDWTSDLVEETSIRLQDAYATLTLVEHDAHVSPTDDSLREHVKLLMGHVQSLHHHLTSFDDEHRNNSAVFILH